MHREVHLIENINIDTYKQRNTPTETDMDIQTHLDTKIHMLMKLPGNLHLETYKPRQMQTHVYIY